MATLRAVEATEEWPTLPISGKTVLIKPNIVMGVTAETGIVTDPEVVRAVVDLVLDGGAAQVLILETSPLGALFDEAGYAFFKSYDPLGRVSLIDLRSLPISATAVPEGHNYQWIYMADLLRQQDSLLISIGKLKTHWETLVTLSTKNLFAFPDVDKYFLPITSTWGGRWSMHVRGISHSIADVNRVCPIHFAVIDGMVAMEGNGPILGNPVKMNTVLAGLNAVAVDRVGAAIMGIPQLPLRHLAYLSSAGLGPAYLSQVRVQGDSPPSLPFHIPLIPPLLEPPRPLLPIFRPALGQKLLVVQIFPETCLREIDIQRLDDDAPTEPSRVRLLRPSGFRRAGAESFVWDGRGDDGALVEPGRYAVHCLAISLRGAEVPVSHSIASITVA